MNMNATRTTTPMLTYVERVTRSLVGIALIGSVFVAGDNTLSWLALLGIYPLYSGLTGTDMRSLFDTTPRAYRLFQVVASSVLIGSVFVISAVPLSVFAVLPLLGSYVALSALLGHSPLVALVDANKAIPYFVSPASDAASVATARTGSLRAA